MRSFLSFVVSSILASSICLAEGPRVWVQPFTEANDHQSADWITKTLQQSLVDELASAKGIQLMQAAAKPADVHFVVTGQIQRLDGELRVTGQVIDTATNKPIGGYKATGSDRELFGIEDSIAAQVKPIVAPADANDKNAVAVAGATTQPSNIQMPFAPNRFGMFAGSDLEQSLHTNGPLQPADNTVYVPTPVYPQQQTYPTNYGLYGSPYGYGYPYNYGWGGGGVVIIGGGGGDGHHHHDHVDNGLPHGNGQAIRAESSFSGNPPRGIVNTVAPYAPGSINTVGPTPGATPSMGRGR